MTSGVIKPLVRKEVRVAIDRHNIHQFKKLEHARPLDRKNVASLITLLRSGGHFETPMCVNDVSETGRERFRLIDGGHRLAAIEAMVKEDTGFSIEVLWHVYDHLDGVQERQVYTLWNRGKRQSIADRVHVNQVDYPIYQLIEKWFPAPVTLYGPREKQRAFPFMPLMRAYEGRLLPYHVVTRTEDFLERLKSYGEGEYEYLKAFAGDFLSAFGDPLRSNPFTRAISIEALVKVHACNLIEKILERKDIALRWRVKVANDGTIRNLIATSSTSGIPAICQAMVAAMNRSYYRRLAITPEEYVKRKKKVE